MNDSPQNNFLILGLGGRGKSFVRFCEQEFQGITQCHLATLDWGGLKRFENNTNLYVPSSFSELSSLTIKRVFVVAGLSGKTGGELIPIIYAFLKKKISDVHILASLPPEFEGTKARTIAKQQLTEIEKHCSHILVYDLKSFEIPEKTSLDEFFKFYDTYLAREIFKIQLKTSKG